LLVVLFLLWNWFFFPAEDGIRVFHVTGVQTCALPISVRPHASLARLHNRCANGVPFGGGIRSGKPGRSTAAGAPKAAVAWARNRSEERRVGKECRSWSWAVDDR